MIALINLSTNGSDTRHKSALESTDITNKSMPSDALSLICHYWSNAARESCFAIAFFTAALWCQSKPLLHHYGPAQQFAIQFARICDCIIVKCHSKLIWNLSLCNAAIQAQSTMCLVFRRAWMRFWYFVCLLCWMKNWFCPFQQPIAVIFQHFAITAHNSSQNAYSIM